MKKTINCIIGVLLLWDIVCKLTLLRFFKIASILCVISEKTVLIFIGIFVISQLINALVSVPMPSLGDNPNPSQQDIIDALSKVEPTALIGSFLFQQFIDVFYCDLRYCNHSSY